MPNLISNLGCIQVSEKTLEVGANACSGLFSVTFAFEKFLVDRVDVKWLQPCRLIIIIKIYILP